MQIGQTTLQVCNMTVTEKAPFRRARASATFVWTKEGAARLHIDAQRTPQRCPSVGGECVKLTSVEQAQRQ
jgi:hypothetical protein